MSLQSPLDPSGSASASGSGSMGRLHPDSQSPRTAASDEADNDNENGPIYFPTRMSAEKSRQSQDGLHSSMDKPGYSDNAAAAAESDQLYQPDEAFAFRLRRRASDGESLAGSYWRMAAEASNTISTRALERSDGMSAKERKRAYWRAAIVNVTLIAGWYLFSTLISIYNKWMFSPDRYNFSFPLFVTSCHMVMQFALATVARTLFEDKLVPRKPNGEPARPSPYDWVSKIVPCALATALDIGLSNTSLKTITLTFYTMCKSSNLAFVLFFAFLFRLEVIRWSLIGIITIITVGVVMMVAAETKFVLIGAVQVLTASAMGGLRWTLTQMLLDRDGMGMNNPIATIFWLAPVMGISLVFFSAIFEDWGVLFGDDPGWFRGVANTIKILGLISAPGVLAFCMNLSEYALIKRTSVVTLSVAGIFKEVMTIMVASIVFGDELTPINVSGLCITLFGIGLYNWLKYRLIMRGPTATSTEGGGGLTESIRSATSSIFRGGRPAASPGGGRYRPVDEGSVIFDEDEDRDAADAVELDTQKVSIDVLRRTSTEERERRRKIEEEAELDGWDSSETRVTGQGLVESHHHLA